MMAAVVVYSTFYAKADNFWMGSRGTIYSFFVVNDKWVFLAATLLFQVSGFSRFLDVRHLAKAQEK